MLQALRYGEEVTTSPLFTVDIKYKVWIMDHYEHRVRTVFCHKYYGAIHYQYVSSLCVQSGKTDMWLSPAFLAMIVGLLVYWLAYMAKTKLQE